MQTQKRDSKPWYKHFWPWYFIGMKVILITACGITAWLIVQNPMSMVVDDYYKEGRTINLQLDKVERAEQLGIAFLVDIEGRQLQIEFTDYEPEDRSSLHVVFYHPTLKQHDLDLRLPHAGDGVYRQQLPREMDGKWRIIIEPFNQQWRVTQEIRLPQTDAFEVVPDNYGI